MLNTTTLAVSGIIFIALTLVPVPADSQAPGVPVLRTFEDLGIGHLYNQYDGVTFVGGDLSHHPVGVYSAGNDTISPPLMGLSTPLSLELTGYPNVVLFFDELQSQVSLSTGIPWEFQGQPLTLLMEGYTSDPTRGGASGSKIYEQPLVQSVANICSPTPTPLNTPVSVADVPKRIRYVALSVVLCSDPYNPNSLSTVGHTGSLGAAFDNLSYTRPLHPRPPDTQPPIINFKTPTDGSIVEGQIPRAVLTTIEAMIIESALYSVELDLNGKKEIVPYYRVGPNDHVSYTM